MSLELKVAIIVGIFFVLLSSFIVYWLIPKRIKKKKCVASWRDLQNFCKDKSTWSDAIKSADNLLNNVLKKKKIKGNSTGERLVSAQHEFSDNDGVWFAHNYYKKTIANPKMRMKEEDVKKALVGFRQALMDIGALPNGEKRK